MNDQAENITETIVAIASGVGGGVGVLRLSGPRSLIIGKKICLGSNLQPLSFSPRKAKLVNFYSPEKTKIDSGLILYFPGPKSFTGEDVVEIQPHGSRFILQEVLNVAVHYGARLARPGEFSERAFINDKIDLIQAEAVADLIESQNKAAAFSAVRSLSGEFSKKINYLDVLITELRVLVEAEIDFPDEDINIETEKKILDGLPFIIKEINNILTVAGQGLILKDGISVIILGKPNTGKSSLINNFARNDVAIVNPTPGTTRDLLEKEIVLGDLPLKIIDSAGLRNTDDEIEKEGIVRASKVSGSVNLILFVQDINDVEAIKAVSKDGFSQLYDILNTYSISLGSDVIVVNNKIDTLGDKPNHQTGEFFSIFNVSIKENLGVNCLKKHIENMFLKDISEGVFSARERHINSLNSCKKHLIEAKENFSSLVGVELVAEDLRLAQNILGEITGKKTSDDLLGEIFSNFCIGK